ncbi:MAG: TrbI/VirB10 family protein [Nitrospirota bacterium]
MATLLDTINKLTDFIKKHPTILIALTLIIALLFFVTPGKTPKKTEKIIDDAKQQQKGNVNPVDELKSQIHTLNTALQEIKKEVNGIKEMKRTEVRHTDEVSKKDEKTLYELENEIKKKKDRISAVEEGAAEQEKPVLSGAEGKVSMTPRIKKIELPPVDNSSPPQSKKADPYLPSASFTDATLLSGAYAPHNGEPMPVSLSIDKAFSGPMGSPVPLKGCLAVAKAVGDIGTGRAKIQVEKMSCRWQDGGFFDEKVNGYLTDEDNIFGIKGDVKRYTGEFLKTTGISAFLQGLSQALATAQTTTLAVAGGTGGVATATNITGDVATYTFAEASRQIASKSGEFYAKQADVLIPVVEVKAGKKVHLYIVDGVTLKGGGSRFESKIPYIDPINLSNNY